MPEASLIRHAYLVKRRFLGMYKAANAGHVGSSLSCAEILVFLRFSWMRAEDRLLLSKGHAAAALYSALAEYGTISKEEIGTFYHDGTSLPAHPPVDRIEGIPFATGSLGHGLSLSAGFALAARLKGENRRAFCITSDGELDEGSTWEAALFIAHRRLDNVVWVIDRNGIQGIGRTEEVCALEPLEAKLKAFGYHVAKANGHDFRSLEIAGAECDTVREKSHVPCVILCATVKGHGLRLLQNTVDSHYLPLSDEQYSQALEDLEVGYALMSRGSRHEG